MSDERRASLMAERGIGPGRQRPVYPRQPQKYLQPGSRFSQGHY